MAGRVLDLVQCHTCHYSGRTQILSVKSSSEYLDKARVAGDVDLTLCTCIVVKALYQQEGFQWVLLRNLRIQTLLMHWLYSNGRSKLVLLRNRRPKDTAYHIPVYEGKPVYVSIASIQSIFYTSLSNS